MNDIDIKRKKPKMPANNTSRDKDAGWVIFTTVISFILAVVLLYLSEKVLHATGVVIAGIVVLIIIFIGIVFDTVGTAVATANEIPFHAMAARKHGTAKHSILLIRNANRVANFCNDIIGDVCGIISGAASTIIIIKIGGAATAGTTTLAALLVGGLVVSLTVGGKAIGKTISLKYSNAIVHAVSGILKFIGIKI
jgi:Mg2+/Co2+ transporter CorB